jgi:deoxyribonuclease V
VAHRARGGCCAGCGDAGAFAPCAKTSVNYFPYILGLLSFREVPVILDALGALDELPDMLLCDGQGIARPRRFGIACHLGVLTGLPTIGVAKSRLCGQRYQVPEGRGEWTPLMKEMKR